MEFNSLIDHTLLAPDATADQIDRVIQEAQDHHFHTVMVNPYWVKKVHQDLVNSDVLTACVIGFPLGANTTRVKLFEAQDALENGVDELDMVMNIGEVVKVIIETCLLTDDEISRAAQLVASTGADFVKTSTGFSKQGATVQAVKLMYEAVKGTTTAVKASGGIHNSADAQAVVDAGATRLGVSHSLAVIGEKAGD